MKCGERCLKRNGLVAEGIALAVLLFFAAMSPVGALAGETELAQARKQFIEKALKNPSAARTAYQTTMAPARQRASQEAFRGLVRGIRRGQEKVLQSMTGRVTRFFSEAGLISKKLLANWHPLAKKGRGGPGPKKAAGAGTSGKKGGRAEVESRPSSGPALQYKGPRVLDFNSGQ